jgi:hypothetical protein
MRTTLLFFLAFASCTATPAEVATYERVAPMLSAYVDADSSLDATERQRRLDLLATWGFRLGKAVTK